MAPKKKAKLGVKKQKASVNSGEKYTLTDRIPIPEPKEYENKYDTIKRILLESDASDKLVCNIKVSDNILRELTPQEIRDLKFVFDTFDVENAGKLGPNEVRLAMKALGFTVTGDDVEEMTNDLAGDGRATLLDFLQFVITRQRDSRDVYQELEKSFQLFDTDELKQISTGNLVELAEESGLPFSEHDCRRMIAEADRTGKGFVDFDDFVNIMLKTNLMAQI